jgi:hypothetical protein
MQRLGVLGTIAKHVSDAKVVKKEPVAAPAPVAAPVAAPAVFLSVSESAEPVPSFTSQVDEVVVDSLEPVVVEEVTPEPSEELCASPLAPASTASSHTESSS